MSPSEVLLEDASADGIPARRLPPAEPAARTALLNIQALRALAAFMVVLVHLQTLAVIGGASEDLFRFGNAGVDIFFVISGFIMVFTTGRRPVGPAAFLLSRIKRVAPLYWAVTLAVFAAAVAAPRLFQHTQADLRHLIGSLLFWPMQRGDGTLRPILFVGWSLNYEMAFYVLFAAGLCLRRRILGVAATVVAMAAICVWTAWGRPDNEQLRFYGSPLILEFGAGMVLGLAWPRLSAKRFVACLLFVAALASAAVILAAPIFWPNAERLWLFGGPATVIVLAALVLEKSGLSLSAPWIRRLGNASYAIYLSHFILTQAVTAVALKLGWRGPLWATALGAACLVGVAGLGLILHYLFERPVDLWLSKRSVPTRGIEQRLPMPGLSQ